ncbi:hypothetical protein BPS26883_01590 [Burkholderia pseudomultivorans]|uniref:Uncharacterized protein n=1 Tax=Burkholderia pseudomultivorans TaxID=1207504 RepID=A0A6P2IX69_9BURK|nr:hypothetical protein BPS26883_01590 [Burkholderia pseudomultivorans]
MSAITVFAVTFAPTILVSPPLTIVAVLRALTCVLFCVAASEFASPCARAIDADTPKPPVPYDTPRLALFDSFVLRVLSVSVLLTRFTMFVARNTTSFAVTSEPWIVTFPCPACLSPVATNAAVPPAFTLLPLCCVLCSANVDLLDDEPKLSSSFASILPFGSFSACVMLPVAPTRSAMPPAAASACSAAARPSWLAPAPCAWRDTFCAASITGDFTASAKPVLFTSRTSSR